MRMLVLSCMAAVTLIGQQVAVGQPVVAVVNVAEVSERYQKTGDLEAQFDEIRKQLNDKRESLRQRIELTVRSLQEEFKPGTDDYRQRHKQLALLEAEEKYFVESETRAIEQGMAQSLRAIFDDIQVAVQQVAEEKGVDIVLAADRMPEGVSDSAVQVRQQIMLQKVLYWSPQVSLTDAVVTRLNATYAAKGGKASLDPAPVAGSAGQPRETR